MRRSFGLTHCAALRGSVRLPSRLSLGEQRAPTPLPTVVWRAPRTHGARLTGTSTAVPRPSCKLDAESTQLLTQRLARSSLGQLLSYVLFRDCCFLCGCLYYSALISPTRRTAFAEHLGTVRAFLFLPEISLLTFEGVEARNALSARPKRPPATRQANAESTSEKA